MSDTLLVEVSGRIAREVQEIAARTQRPVDELVNEWLERWMDDLPVEWLSDSGVLDLIHTQMSLEDDEALSELLAHQRENRLNEANKMRLDLLMNWYRRGLVRKSEALKVAVQRGLLPPLNEWSNDPLELPNTDKNNALYSNRN